MFWFIVETVGSIARPIRKKVQNVAYNWHKRMQGLKRKAATALDGLLLHAYGPLGGSRHEWTLYIRSRLEESLPPVMLIIFNHYAL